MEEAIVIPDHLRPFTIAVDGPAGAGKGTLTRALSQTIVGAAVLDTGAIYRAVALMVRERGIDPADEPACAALARALDPTDTTRHGLRSEEVGQIASRISALPSVRAALDAFQKDFVARPPGGICAILDGRDIGTVIAPQAPVKLYLTASAAERARRRHAEALARGEVSDLEAIRASIEERDAREASRAVAPMKPAPDALVIDTDGLDAHGVLGRALARIRHVLLEGHASAA